MMSDDAGSDQTRSCVVPTAGAGFSHYNIISRLGAGGMGEVYLAEDTELDRKVALKFLLPHLCQDSGCRERFKREARAAARLDHPNIVTIHEVNEYGGRPYIAMQYVPGRSMREVIKRKELTIEEAIRRAMHICDGLRKAHQAGIVHRDIKPSNIVVDAEGSAKLLDFGLAAVTQTDKITKTGSTLGTFGYMSPEQIRGENVDPRSDVFSLGIVLFEMLTFDRPFHGDNEAALSHAIVYDTPPLLTGYDRDIPPGLQAIIDRMLEKDVEKRYGAIDDVLRDLTKIQEDIESVTGRTGIQSSIAVLPFTNLSADPEQEYFCDGMAEEIISELTHIEDLRVVARTSCFAFKGKQVDIRDIGRKLNVGTLLEGSVRKAGNRLRITAQLVNVSDGYHLWSERYDREIEDIFAVQDEISAAIAEKLRVKLLKKDRAVLKKRFAIDPEAYNLYLKGRFFWSKRTREGFDKAIDYFKKAVDIEPTYAQAYAGIAVCYNDLPNYSTYPPSAAYPPAREAALKALEIDDENAEAHTALGLIKSDYEWDWEGSEKEFLRAIELNPAYETAHHWYALLLINLGRNDEAIAEMRRAHELDPLSLATNRNLGFLYYFARRYDDALKILHRAAEMDPSFSYTHYCMGCAYLRKQEFGKAIDALKKERDLSGGVNPIVVIPLGMTYARMGDPDKADEVLAGIEERMKHEYVSPFFVAQLYFALGRLDDGFALLDKGFSERDIFMREIKATPMEEEVIRDPRYAALLKKMNLV